MRPVGALGLAALVKTQPQQDDIGAFGKAAGLPEQPFALAAHAPEAAREADDVDAGFFERGKAVVEHGRLDVRAARALIPRGFREIADDRDAAAGLYGQYAALVFQQHGALGGEPRGKGVVLGFAEAHVLLKRRSGGEHRVEQHVDALVKKLLVQLTAAHGENYLPVGIASGAGHFEVVSRDEAAYSVVIAAPVGHDHAPVAPVAEQDILQKVGVLVGVDAVDPVIGGHDAADAALPDCRFKGRQVYLAQGALVNDRVVGHAQKLLGVCGKVLDAGGDAV